MKFSDNFPSYSTMSLRKSIRKKHKLQIMSEEIFKAIEKKKPSLLPLEIEW